VLVPLGIIGILLVILVAVVVYPLMFGSRSDAQIAQSFLTELLEGDTEAAANYLSTDLKGIVADECPDSSVVRCVEGAISPAWGSLEEVYFGIGSGSGNTILFYTAWSNLSSQLVAVAIMMGMENNTWVVTGWRGFIVSQGEDFDSGFLRGTRHDNEFPPLSNG
jgi:hypothetical protein